MPRQTKVIHFSGKMGGKIYYYRKDRKRRKHYFIRRAPQTVLQTTATKRTATDFGTASKGSRLVREALEEYTRFCYDNRLHARLAGKLVPIVRADVNHLPGQRILTAANMQALQHFRFNEASSVYQVLKSTPVIEKHDSGISISFEDTFSNRSHALRNITHVTIKAIALSVNLIKGTTRKVESNTVVVKRGEKFAPLIINMNRRNLKLIILEVQSFFDINCKSHNKSAHALDIISVLPPIEAPEEQKRKYRNKAPRFWLPYIPAAKRALLIKRVNYNSLPEG